MNGTAASAEERQIVESAWQDQAVWSEAANRLISGITAWRARAAVALSGAAILAVVPYVVKTKASKDRVRDWVRARSVSEALKEEIYRFLVKAPPFDAAGSPAELVRRCREVKDKARDLSAHAAAAQPARKERPLALTIDAYVEKRVDEQIENYYLRNGRLNAQAAGRLHGLEFGLGLAAVLMGALAGAAAAAEVPKLAVLAPWVAVVTTAGAAVTAHLAAARYDHSAITYFGTADRLKGIRDEWRADPNRLDPARRAKFVDDCEHAISTENEAWLANWTREPDES